VKHWCILSYFSFTALSLLTLIGLTFTYTFSACLFDFSVGRIDPGTFGMARPSCCSVHSGFSMLWSCPISVSPSTAQSSSLSFTSYKFSFKWSQSAVSEMISGALSWSLSIGSWLILWICQTSMIRVRPPGRTIVDTGGGKGDLTDNLNAAAPSCWKSDHYALTISLVSEMYPTVVISLFRAHDFLCVVHRFRLPCNIPKSCQPWPFCAVSFPPPLLHFRGVFGVHWIQFWVCACWYPVIGLSKLPYNNFLVKGLACALWLPPAYNISATGKNGLHSGTMSYDSESVARHNAEIAELWMNFPLLMPPVGYVRYPKCTANLHWVGVVNIDIWIIILPVLRWFRWRIEMELDGSQ